MLCYVIIVLAQEVISALLSVLQASKCFIVLYAECCVCRRQCRTRSLTT